MLRGDRSQQALGQLAALPNMHLLASIDHINATLGQSHASALGDADHWYYGLVMFSWSVFAQSGIKRR